MYGSDWTHNPDGAWTASRVIETYSPLDLYLMGLLPPAQVPFFTLLRNPAVDPARVASRGRHRRGRAAETITVGQVIAAEGLAARASSLAKGLPPRRSCS